MKANNKNLKRGKKQFRSLVFLLPIFPFTLVVAFVSFISIFIFLCCFWSCALFRTHFHTHSLIHLLTHSLARSLSVKQSFVWHIQYLCSWFFSLFRFKYLRNFTALNHNDITVSKIMCTLHKLFDAMRCAAFTFEMWIVGKKEQGRKEESWGAIEYLGK